MRDVFVDHPKSGGCRTHQKGEGQDAKVFMDHSAGLKNERSIDGFSFKDVHPDRNIDTDASAFSDK